MTEVKRMIGYFHSLQVPYKASKYREIVLEHKRKKFNKIADSIQDKTDVLDYRSYGSDLELILFQFILFPDDETANVYRNVEYYRPKEKAISLNVLIDDANFFALKGDRRKQYLQDTMIERLEELSRQSKIKSLDVDMEKLIADVKTILA